MASVKFNSDGADGLQKSLGALKNYVVRVGILGQKDQRAGDLDGNSDIGFKHEFGFTVTEGHFKGALVPPRSFLGMPLRSRRRNITRAVSGGAMGLLKGGKALELLRFLGVAAENVIHEAFATSGWGTWAPNAQSTKILKDSDKPLIDTAQLERSIVSKVVRKGK